MVEQSNDLLVELLRSIRADAATNKVELKGDIADAKSELRAEIHSLRADVASDVVAMQKDTRDQIVGLRRAVVEYHSAVIGHGVIISELEARMRRVEQHLNLPSLDPH